MIILKILVIGKKKKVKIFVVIVILLVKKFKINVEVGKRGSIKILNDREKKIEMK